jgi:hypothetical protein
MNASLNPFDDEPQGVLSPYEYKLKIRWFANDTVDYVMQKIKHRLEKSKEAFTGTQTLYPRTLTAEEQAEKTLENIKRAATRAKQSVHFAVRSLGADHMLTLTTRENMTDRAQFLKTYQEFVRLVRTKDLTTVHGTKMLITRKEKRVWGYVAVPELQERGAYHMHIACVGKQDLALLNACWYVALDGTPNDSGSDTKGAVNVRYRDRRFSGQTELHKTFTLVSYLTKYITKSFEAHDELGVRRYNASQQIPKPIVHTQFIWSSFQNGAGDFTTAMQEVYAIASFHGIKSDMQPWNRGEDVFILRGSI